MIIVNTDNPTGIWTEGPYRRFIASFLSHNLQSEVSGFSMGMVILPPGGKGNPHSHPAAQESWYVLEGHGRVVIGEETAPIRKGDVIYGPAGVAHALINDSDSEPLKALLVLCPGGDERNVTDVLLSGGGMDYESGR
ncbi:MAG: cupin domain-containing protein [Eubacteriales bacterium]